MKFKMSIFKQTNALPDAPLILQEILKDIKAIYPTFPYAFCTANIQKIFHFTERRGGGNSLQTN